MTPVFQVYKKHFRIPKAHYTPQIRKEMAVWEDSVSSKIGFLQQNVLILPQSEKVNFALNPLSAVILIDTIGFNAAATAMDWRNVNVPNWFIEQQKRYNTAHHYCIIGNSQNHVELFTIKEIKTTEPEIWLKYKGNEMKIGDPVRENHKMCGLKIGESLRFRINGINDFSMTGRREREFVEFDYIIHFQGIATQVDFVAPSKLKVLKSIPQTFEKDISLRKKFY